LRGGFVTVFSSYPGFVPGLAVSLVVAVAGSRRLAVALGIGRLLAIALILAIGAIVSATLFPDLLGLGSSDPVRSTGWTCDLERFTPSLHELLDLKESTANVVLFVPLGICAALLPRRWVGVAIVSAFVTPVAIELIQMLLPWLHRACQSADVADNVTGLAVGLAAGAGGAWAMRLRERRRSSGPNG
jgi:glycopeptide antibiotics resistance protein